MMHGDAKFTGATLDVDYDFDPFLVFNPLLSLQELCEEKILSNFFLIEDCLDSIPHKILNFLMRKALEEGRFPVVAFLLRNWPYKAFIYPQLSYLKDLGLSCTNENIAFCVTLRKAVECSSRVLSLLLEIMKDDLFSTKLESLDLSQMPLGEILTTKICDFITKRLTYVHPASTETRKFTMKLHCTVSTIQKIETLYNILTEQKKGLSDISISMYALVFTETTYHTRITEDLLNLLNPMDLEMLAFDFSNTFDHSIEKILLCLHRFHNLRILDFSYFRPRLFGRSIGDYCGTLREVFRELPHITRLDFNNCNVGKSVEYLLGHLYQGNVVCTIDNAFASCKGSAVSLPKLNCAGFSTRNLEYLNLSSTCLSACDMEYLAKSRHARTLKNLNLSWNALQLHFNSLLTLLHAVAPTLCVLEISSNNIRDEQLGDLFATLSEMQNLRYLNIAHLCESSATQLRLLPMLLKLPLLRTVCLSEGFSTLSRVYSFRERASNRLMCDNGKIRIIWRY